MPEVTRKSIVSQKVAAPIGPYSIAVTTGELLFISGTLGTHPLSGELVQGGVEEETRQALRNISLILSEGSSSLGQVMKTTVYMRDLREFSLMNEVYAEFFKEEPPARSTVQVAGLPKGASVEIEAIAFVPSEDNH